MHTYHHKSLPKLLKGSMQRGKMTWAYIVVSISNEHWHV